MKTKKMKKQINRKQKLMSIMLNSNNIQLIDKINSTLICKCGICGTNFKIVGYIKRNKIVCPSCKRNELAERKREKRLNNLHSDITTIKKKCSYMPYCFSTNKFLCPDCILKAHPYYTKTDFKNTVNDANKSITLIGDYVDSLTPIKYKCNVCGNVSFGKPYNLLKGLCGCKKCHQSNGERIISLYLFKHNVKYEIEKIFDDCRYKYPLRFDFYLSDYNVAIEYDGKQHFEPMRFSLNQNPNDLYKDIVIRDNIKNDYCKDKKIILIRIKYTEQDIFKFLDNNLLPIINSFRNIK